MAHAEDAASAGGVVAPPSPEAIRVELNRIQTSADFEVPGRAHKFLGYVVEETLAGRADRIKAYSIALEVFGRDSSFDAQADPVVRIEAGRVRRALERYYLTAGKSDPILITIPKGGYVPQFEERASNDEAPPPVAPPVPVSAAGSWQRFPRWQLQGLMLATGFVVAAPLTWNYIKPQAAPQHLTSSVSQPDIPRLLIEPFEDLTGTEGSAILARGLTEEIMGQIAKFKDLQVVETPPGSTKSLAGTVANISARYALLGGVRVAGNTLRLTARLRNLDDGSILWAESYDEDLAVQDVLAVQADIAREVVTALAQPYGVIFQIDSTRTTQAPPDDWDAYTCTLSYYTYGETYDREAHSEVQACLEKTVETYPAYASAWALLSMAYLDNHRFHISESSRPALDGALAAAKRAVALDSGNARASEALMMALYFKGEIQAALEVGADALEINRNDTQLLAAYGLRVALSGEWERGRLLETEALTRMPVPPSPYYVDLAVIDYMLKDYSTAREWIERTNFPANPIYHLVAAAIYGQLGSATEGERSRNWLLANSPDLITNIRTDLARRIVRAEDRAHFIDGLIMAGLPIPPEP
jgi:TolB-like protein